MSYTSEKSINVWNDQHGDCVYVGPDADGGDLVELRYVDADGKVFNNNRLSMEKEQAILVAKAILELYGDTSS